MSAASRIESLERRVRADPSSVAFASLAEEYRRAGRLGEAIEASRSGLERHPTYASARVTLARTLLELGQLDEARAEFETVLEVAPENLAAVRGLAEVHRGLGDRAGTVEYLKRALTLAPLDAELRNAIAEAEQRMVATAPEPIVVREAPSPTPVAAPAPVVPRELAPPPAPVAPPASVAAPAPVVPRELILPAAPVAPPDLWAPGEPLVFEPPPAAESALVGDADSVFGDLPDYEPPFDLPLADVLVEAPGPTVTVEAVADAELAADQPTTEPVAFDAGPFAQVGRSEPESPEEARTPEAHDRLDRLRRQEQALEHFLAEILKERDRRAS